MSELQAPGNRLRCRFSTARLLHTCDAATIEAAVASDPHLLLGLSWKHLGFQHPQLAVQLARSALASATSDVSKEKRWQLVRPVPPQLMHLWSSHGCSGLWSVAGSSIPQSGERVPSTAL